MKFEFPWEFHCGKRLTSPGETMSPEETFTNYLTTLQERQELRFGEGFRDGKALII